MKFTISEKIRVLSRRNNMTLSQIAETMGQSRQNFSNKMSKNNFTEEEAKQIAKIFGAEFICRFQFPDGTEI